MTRERLTFIGAMLVAAFIGGGVASLVFSGRVSAQGSPAVVTTGQVNLVSRAGRIRGILSAEDERGLASLTLFDEAGERRSALTVGRDGSPTFQLYDRAQAARLVLAVENDQPALVINGETGQRAVLSNLVLVQSLHVHDVLTWNVPSWSISTGKFPDSL